MPGDISSRRIVLETITQHGPKFKQTELNLQSIQNKYEEIKLHTPAPH